MHTYCLKWGLEVNTSRTKIVVFRKKGKLKDNEKWTYGNTTIEVVNNFNYLGVVLNYTGNFNLHHEHLKGKALKALNVLLKNCSKIKLKPKILCQLFDSFVGSVLSYGSEIWGYTKSKDLERIHMKFCKRILNVRKNTSSASIYGELGRYPLFIAWYVRMIKYWFKIVNTDNKILHRLYAQSLHYCEIGCKNWVYRVKDILCRYGFQYVFYNNENIDHKMFIGVFKQRIIDCFLQEWQSSINESSLLDTYKLFKANFEYETYLDILPLNLRSMLSKLRLSSHSLRIQTGRYSNVCLPRNERICLYCTTRDIEDEYHFVITCPVYTEIRKKYIKRYYYKRPSMYKFVQLMRTSKKTELLNLARYIKEAFYMRNHTNILNI